MADSAQATRPGAGMSDAHWNDADRLRKTLTAMVDKNSASKPGAMGESARLWMAAIAKRIEELT